MELNIKNKLIERILGKKSGNQNNNFPDPEDLNRNLAGETSFERHPGYLKMMLHQAAGRHLNLDNPFFRTHDGLASAETSIDGNRLINFSNYNYLGLNGHQLVNQAALEAIERYGTSVSASRLVAGERPFHKQLERALADLYGVDDCLVMVSGHATNVSTLECLMRPNDLIVHDALIHNSILEGAKLSGAARRFFPHNDLEALDQLLSKIRKKFEQALIVVEGVYSMDGDYPDLPALLEIKKRHRAFLMVDEAHSLGVLGPTGKGLSEHFGLNGREVDIWMGTLSKTFAGCGGFIAGSEALIELLKYTSSGFVYSVGLAPPLAGASLKALEIMLAEPERVRRLRARTKLFLNQASEAGLNTGFAKGYAVVPVIVGSSIKAVTLSNRLLSEGFNVLPIIYPAVPEKSARLRFFLSASHSEGDIYNVCKALKICS
jgi:8-amino-7-oxononanoate synthase